MEQLDILRFGIVGAFGGLIIGLLAAILLNVTELFGQGLPSLVYVAIIVGLIAFGAWEGGLTGIASENKKIALFHDDLESGRYLILIYATTTSEQQIKKILEDQHAEAKLVAVDATFYNPFTGLKRIA
ncbi:MAG: hypothetical protein Q8Q40_05745 [Methylococcaceae bacterium]|nr:hypothetical protein [Methylococcaceae bacterium]